MMKDGRQLPSTDSKDPETLMSRIVVSYSHYFQIDE